MPDSSNALLDAIANPRQVDVLGAYRGANNILQGQWAVREMQAKQRAGELFGQSLNADGTTNQPRLNQLIQQAGPSAALAAPQISQAGLTNSTGEFSLQQAKLAMIAQSNMELYARFGGKPPLDAIKANIEKHAKSMGFNPQQVTDAEAQFGDDPVANGQTILQNTVKGVGALDAMHAAMPRTGTYTGQGGMLQGYGTPPLLSGGGAAVSAPPQPGVQQGLTPQQLDAPFTYKDAKGADQTTTYRQWLIDNHFPGAMPGGPSSAPGGLPPSLRGPNASPSSGPVASPSPAPVQTSPSPASLEQQKQTAAQSATKFQGESDADVSAQQQLATLGNMQANIGQFVTGSGAGKTLDWKRFIQSWTPEIAKKLGIDPNAVAGQEDFDKAVNQLLTQQNAGSDKQLSVGIGATPHSTLSPEGVDLIIRQLQGNSDYLRARAKLANAYGDKTDYPGFQQSIRDLDPRVFQLRRMKEDQQTTYFNSLGKTQREELKAAWAKTKGLLGP